MIQNTHSNVGKSDILLSKPVYTDLDLFAIELQYEPISIPNSLKPKSKRSKSLPVHELPLSNLDHVPLPIEEAIQPKKLHLAENQTIMLLAGSLPSPNSAAVEKADDSSTFQN